TGGEEEADPFNIRLATFLVLSKCDLLADVEGELAVFRELSGLRYPALAVSVETGAGLDELAPFLFRELGVARVYTKV
ncbi:MAG: GTPase, partial [Actinobacteria bacterium]|nr:GTPase [Actinomycetota bacterium]NIU65005.1 GTPase [Actinomycetota bacterium]